MGEIGSGEQRPSREVAEMQVLAGVPPLVWVTLALLCGQLLTGWCSVLPLAVLLALAALALLIIGLARQFAVGVVLLAFAWGNWSASTVLHRALPADHVAHWCGAGPVRIDAQLLEDPERAPRRGQLRLRARRVVSNNGSHAVDGVVLLSVRSLRRDWWAGDQVRLRVRLRRPRNFGNPGEFDYQGYLARRGVYVTAFLFSDEGIELRERPAASNWLDAWRRGTTALIDQRLDGTARPLLRALIVGDTAGIPRSMRQAFARAGVSHVLSISGLHVGMVAAFGYLFWRWLLARSRWLLLRAKVPKLAVAGSVMLVALYAGIAGGSTATVRSVIMVVVFLGSVVLDRQRDLLVSLAAAALLISCVWPGSVLDISFQLSFSAVLFLVLGMNRFWPWWRRWEEVHLVRLRGGAIRLARPIAAYLAVSVFALAGTAALTAFHFNQVSLVALAANALVVPLLGTAAVGLGLAAALIYPVWQGLAGWCVLLAWPFLWLGGRLVGLFAALPFAALRTVTPSVFEVALMYAGLLALLFLRRRPRMVALGALILLTLGDASWWYWGRFHRSGLQVTFLSVGQGDSTVIECPGSEVMVVDGGGLGDGSFDVGERVIAPFLWSRKVGHIDILVMSHPQWDHYGGLAFLVRNFSPGEFWSSGDEAEGSVRFAALKEALVDTGVPTVIVRPGMQWQCGDATVRVLGPVTDIGSVNDRSLVLQLCRGAVCILLTGDIEREGEAALLAATEGMLASTVMKVPHHGSATSSTPAFVDTVAPRVAIASLGFANRFGLPHSRTLATYERVGTTFLRTDRDGAVMVSVDSASRVETRVFRQSKRKMSKVARSLTQARGGSMVSP